MKMNISVLIIVWIWLCSVAFDTPNYCFASVQMIKKHITNSLFFLLRRCNRRTWRDPEENIHKMGEQASEEGTLICAFLGSSYSVFQEEY